jgi:ribosomal protein S18 acetylase RimI-like enzyme
VHAAVAATWPAAREVRVGPVTLREGLGGGSRVSAATVEGPWTGDDLDAAETGMAALGQGALFMLREGDTALDAALAARGYAVMDPVVGYVVAVEALALRRPPPVTTFEVWPPLAAQAEIWAEGGIGPARLAVMERAPGPKVAILGRLDDSPAGAGFVALHQGLAMVHAIEVRERFRRRGLGAHMLRAAAFWAREQGAGWVGLVVTEANAGARALYAGLGMVEVARYHYRVRAA